MWKPECRVEVKAKQADPNRRRTGRGKLRNSFLNMQMYLYKPVNAGALNCFLRFLHCQSTMLQLPPKQQIIYNKSAFCKSKITNCIEKLPAVKCVFINYERKGRKRIKNANKLNRKLIPKKSSIISVVIGVQQCIEKQMVNNVLVTN